MEIKKSHNKPNNNKGVNDKEIINSPTNIHGISNLHAKKTCSQFNTWKEADTYFKAKKSGYKSLDRNHDGKPCETLWKKSLSKEKKKTHIKIYQYGGPAGQGRRFSSMSACEKERVKLTKVNEGTDYTYKCESN